MLRLRRRGKVKRTYSAGNQKGEGSSNSNDTKPLGAEPVSRFKILAGFRTDVGCVREANEDRSLYVQPDPSDPRSCKGALFLVADGMGGHQAGEIASEMAVNIVSRTYYQSTMDSQSALSEGFVEANRLIYEASRAEERLKGMGTTCTALVLRNGSAVSAHVGDSRIYLVRGGEIYLMTEDHSQVMEMVKRGLLTLDEARRHPDKNVILRALGTQPEVQVAFWNEPFPVRCDDRFVLCSDGLNELVEDNEIKQAVAERDPISSCEMLIVLARERGGHDNITVGVIAIQLFEGGATPPVKETRETEVV